LTGGLRGDLKGPLGKHKVFGLVSSTEFPKASPKVGPLEIGGYTIPGGGKRQGNLLGFAKSPPFPVSVDPKKHWRRTGGILLMHNILNQVKEAYGLFSLVRSHIPRKSVAASRGREE